MARKYTKYTKEILEPIIRSSLSFAECLKKLGVRATGGNYKNLQRNIEKFGLDTSHMLNQAINSGKEFKRFDDIKKPETIKRRLVKERGYLCERCFISEWLNEPIVLELEHCDGDNRNNSRENLKLLCPNCHSQTLTWRNRKRN